jgi:hypothetical protein
MMASTMRTRTVALATVSTVAVLAGLTAALQMLRHDPVPGGQQGLLPWPGPIHLGPVAAVQAMARLDDRGHVVDRRDAAIAWADITEVDVTIGDQFFWVIGLAGKPPRAAALSGAATRLTYGWVFETTGDGVADYMVGISNDAPKPGDFRVWVTDLATGAKEEQVGPPYGSPFDFRHPDEQDQAEGAPNMVFMLLAGRERFANSRFYAWTSVTDDGDVVAWDYAPDDAWLSAPPRS